MIIDDFLEFIGETNEYSTCCNGVDCQECEYLPLCAEVWEQEQEYSWELNAGIYDPPSW